MTEVDTYFVVGLDKATPVVSLQHEVDGMTRRWVPDIDQARRIVFLVNEELRRTADSVPTTKSRLDAALARRRKE